LKQKETLCINKKPKEQLQAQGWKRRDNEHEAEKTEQKSLMTTKREPDDNEERA